MTKFPIPDAALARHIACVGETGSGKTHDTKAIVEHVVAEGYRVCVLDTIKSDWWGITSSASGKRPGLPFTILGGPRGHVPLHSNAGKAIGQLVGEGALPHSIIDMADFEPGGPQRFFEHFAQALWKHTKGVVYLVIEEAHEIAPKERAGFGAENMAIHWAKKLATGSRTKGIRLIIASQRTQAVHNALLGSCGTLMAHSLSLPADQRPILDWLKANVRDTALQKTIESDLAFLPTGTAWVCCAKDNFFKKVAFPKIATFDNTATPDKDADEFDVATAAVDAGALRSIIGDAVKEAEANDPKALKTKVAELSAQLLRKPVIDETVLKRSNEVGFEAGRSVGYHEGLDAGREIGWTQCREATGKVVSQLHEHVTAMAGTLDALSTWIGETSKPPPIDAAAFKQAWQAPTDRPPALRPAEEPYRRVRTSSIETPKGNGHAPAPAIEPKGMVRDILDAIHAAYPASMSFAAAAKRAGASSRSSAYSKYEAAVRASIEVQESDGRFKSAPGFEKPLAAVPGESPVEKFARRLTPSYAAMLRTIAESYPHTLTRDQVAEGAKVSPTSSGLGSGIRELLALELIVEAGGVYRLSEDMR